MSLEQRTRQYEILVRFNENGKVGAYKQSITEILSDEVLVTSSINAPEVLDLAQLHSAINSITEADWFVPEAEEDV